MASKFYELYDSGNVDSSILEEKLGQSSFEDHYWHLACLAKYYELNNQNENEKATLSKMCDLNYVFNAFYHYNKYDCLPNNYKQYITPFENSMVDKRIEDRIEHYNKLEKRKKAKTYWLSSLTSLISIPVMLFLMFVCNLDSSTSLIITIVVLMIIQLFSNPMMENTFLKRTFRKMFPSKKKAYVVPVNLAQYFKYLDRFVKIVNNDLYLALARAKDEKEIEEVVKAIKKEKPIV